MASRSLGQLTIDLVANVGGFVAGMGQAEREAQRRARNIQRSMNGVRNAVTSAFAFVGGAVLIRKVVAATEEAEKSFALLTNAIEATGGSAGRTADQLTGMADDLQAVTTYSDDAIVGAEQLLLRFQSIQGLNFDRALTSTLDLATALGKDLNSAALLVGKALENPVKGLTQLERSGVVLSDSQKELVKRLVETGQKAEAQGVLLEALEGKYRGAAIAARNTFGGALDGLKNAFENLLEGDKGLESATDAVNDLTATLNDPEVKAGFDTIVGGIFKVIEMATKGAAALADFSRWIGETVGHLANGAAFDDIPGITADIEELQEEIARLQDLGGIGTALEGGSEAVTNRIESYKKQLADLTVLLKEAQAAAAAPAKKDAAAGGTGAPGSAGITPPPTEEFTKLSARLEEQIALFGKTGEAAKIAYDIQSGKLDELTEKEQQRLLVLAEQIDSLNGVGEAAASIYSDQEKRAAAALQSTVELRNELNDFIEDFGTDYEEVTQVLIDATADYVDDTEKSLDKVSTFAEEASRNIQDFLGDSLYDVAKGNFDNIGDAFADMILRMVTEAAAADLGKILLGEGGIGSGGGWIGRGMSWLGGLFGGGLAGGGTAAAGRFYEVNEQGTEMLSVGGRDYLMMGAQSGMVTPAGGVGGTHVSQVIQVTGRVDQRSARQIQLEAAREQRVASGRFA